MTSPLSLRLLYAVHLACLLGTALPASAQSDSIDTWIEGYMKDTKAPGLALAILEGGRIVKAKGYGLANVEHEVPVTPSTVFQSASLGKTFTAASILLLAADGKLALDDPIAKYLDAAPDAWRGITIRHLVTHTSGIPNYEETTELDLRNDYTDQQLVQVFARLPLLGPPGEEWAYSNTGYVLLGMIIGEATGEHWSKFVRKRICEPLGLKSTGVISEVDIVPHRAAGYQIIQGEVKNQDWVAPNWNRTADGSLYTTLNDLARWDVALRGSALLDESWKSVAFAPARLNDGSSASYGFGWFLGDEPQGLVETSGGWQGFRNHIVRYLQDSITVIVLSNATSVRPSLVAYRVAALYDRRLAPPSRKPTQVPAKALREYAGRYRMAPGDTIMIRETEDGVAMTGLGPSEIRFRPYAKDSFFIERTGSRLIFVRDPTTRRVAWARPLQLSSSPARARRMEPGEAAREHR